MKRPQNLRTEKFCPCRLRLGNFSVTKNFGQNHPLARFGHFKMCRRKTHSLTRRICVCTTSEWVSSLLNFVTCLYSRCEGWRPTQRSFRLYQQLIEFNAGTTALRCLALATCVGPRIEMSFHYFSHLSNMFFTQKLMVSQRNNFDLGVAGDRLAPA